MPGVSLLPFSCCLIATPPIWYSSSREAFAAREQIRWKETLASFTAYLKTNLYLGDCSEQLDPTSDIGGLYTADFFSDFVSMSPVTYWQVIYMLFINVLVPNGFRKSAGGYHGWEPLGERVSCAFQKASATQVMV